MLTHPARTEWILHLADTNVKFDLNALFKTICLLLSELVILHEVR
jgi:hypothetical protein